MPRPLLDKKTIGEIFGCSIPTIDRWIESGRLPYIKLGDRLVRFDPDVIDRISREGLPAKVSAAR